MIQKQIYTLYNKKHKDKIVAFMNTLNVISELSAKDVVELLNNYEKDCVAYEQLLRKNARTIDRLKKKIQQLEDYNNKNIHTYDHCYKEVSNKLYAYKQLLKSLARNAVGIQDICNNAVNCDEISCDGKNITIKAGKQTIDVEVDNGKQK